MLKALELSGFKSFADKTRFEFPPGITVVVGPNGSGKSNIVDAIKWVLGEQSAKSLRGKDMSDVIFKGSTGGNARRPANSATATIVLENSDKRFAYDADEVHVTRRVYRSGESEYLINGETTRLKDIRELFRGTGVGTDAYSLIEQGKVERMLSTNAKDRRAIFEEAAGISRFKAKKIEAQRRLTRVEGNLVRLADIVDEVGSRYRSVKAQASKAARYKEHSDRLQQLRTFVGLKDWRSFSEKLAKIEQEFEAESKSVDEFTQQIESQAGESQAVESRLEEITTGLTEQQEKATQVRERFTQVESHLTLNRSRLDDIQARRLQLTEQLERSAARTQESETRIQTAEKAAEDAEINYRDASDRLQKFESQRIDFDQQLEQLKSSGEESRAKYTTVIALVTQVGRLVSAADSQVETLNATKTRLTNVTQELSDGLAKHQASFEQFTAEKERLKQEAESKDSALAEARKRYEDLRSELAGRRERMSDLTNQHSGLSQRAEVIEELEQSLEGINAGAKELLQLSKSGMAGPMSDVVGLVADLVSVNVQHAAIVDVALGEMAQFVVVDGKDLINQVADETLKLNGRVGLIQLDAPPTLGADPDVNLNGASGVIGRADRLVQVQPPYVPFIRRLLGGTWVVKTLGEALHLHANEPSGDKVRYVTLDGEVVESDGAVVVGPKSVTSGLVSRRSELRALKREIEKLDGQISQCREQVGQLTGQESDAESKIEFQINENSELSARLSEQTLQAKAAEKLILQTQEQVEKSTHELGAAQSQLAVVEAKLDADRNSLSVQELEVASLTELIASVETNASEIQKQRSTIEKSSTAAKVQLAKSEQLLDGVQARVAQYRQEFEEQTLANQQLNAQFESDDQAKFCATEEIENATEELAQLVIQKDEFSDVLTRFTQDRLEVDAQRRKLATELNRQRDQLRTSQDKVHQSKMRIEQLKMQRGQLAERMQEDYGIDIATVEDDPTEEQLEERDQIDAEITQLRKKIGSIGSVNLDALQELEDLESRYLAMDAQYQDLVQAKETLEKIIDRIDNDSRKLFVETLEAIRLNFQKLFRQTFGGGKADIILEPNVDPLEAGVDIIATPPGKPEFSNSLLSGGEKALTAVSLLMAIFQFRPSPFCVLDEVDAPFDEANIGRFVDVLKSFLGWTKFVIVTHSKKTMTAATTLYGITMQESGVSKRVSVRFEDVSEDGHISDEALHRDDDAA
ncbi:MAG: chromosome segregation protein [Mariniblastus sp.]|jgi:chromosome segregation protein